MEQDYSSIITLFSKDIDNMHNIEEYYILDNSIEAPVLVAMFSKTEDIISDIKGLFTQRLNKKYVILSKDTLKPYCKKILAFLINIKDSFKSFQDTLPLINLCNIFLIIASSNTTIYNIKKKILLHHGNNLSIEIIINELKYTQLTSCKNRKCAISWDYREFLMENYWNQLIEYYAQKTIDHMNTNISNIAKSMNLTLTISNFIMAELENMALVNIQEKRNYHLWTYMNKLLRKCTIIDDKRAIVFFAYGLFINCFNDYSAFSFIMNFYNTIGLSHDNITNLKAYISSVCQLNKQEKNIYYIQLYQEMTDQRITNKYKH